jgi:hypothetical protein
MERSGKRSSGSWDTQKWLIGKKLAHVVKEKLMADYRRSGESAGEVPVQASKGRKTRSKTAGRSRNKPDGRT